MTLPKETPMIEKCARALCEAQGYAPSENEIARATEEVRAVLTALREPTEAMLDEGEQTLIGQKLRRGTVGYVWRSMIDEALREGEQQ